MEETKHPQTDDWIFTYKHSIHQHTGMKYLYMVQQVNTEATGTKQLTDDQQIPFMRDAQYGQNPRQKAEWWLGASTGGSRRLLF